MAVVAGNDLIELSEDVELAISTIRKALRRGVITWKQVDQRVKRILAAKEWAGLDHYEPVDTEGLFPDLNRPETGPLIHQLSENTVTLRRHNSPNYFYITTPSQKTVVIYMDTQ